MTLGILIQIASTFAIISLVSIGGVNAVLPEIRRQVVDIQGWMTDASFANAFASLASMVDRLEQLIDQRDSTS